MLADLNARSRARRFQERWKRVSGEIGRGVASRRKKGEGAVEPLFIPFSLGIMAAPVPLWLFVSPAAWDGVFWYTYEHASLPILLWFLVGMRLFMPGFWATSDWPMRGLTAIIATAMCAFMAQAHVAASTSGTESPSPSWSRGSSWTSSATGKAPTAYGCARETASPS